MSIHVSLHHKTTYKYERPIQLGPQIIRLKPAPHSRTPVLSYSLKVFPDDHFINWQQDPQGNYLARLVFPNKTDLFDVEVSLTADMTTINPFDFFLQESAEQFPFKYEKWLSHELKPFLHKLPAEPAFQQFLKNISRKRQPTNDFLVYLNQMLQQEISYLIRLEPGVQTPEETLTKKSGSCRDSAWLLVQLLRHLGLAARFVSGYLIQLKADVKSLDGPSGTEEDFTDLHAWAEVYLPGAGWVGLDPTSGLLTGEGHIPLVATPEPSSAAPISGMLEACETDFKHVMTVTRFHEDPRVTKPYTDDQWQRIMKIGHQVDKGLAKEKVHLTMGGEPTFVSIDDMESAQWNTAALGEHKRRLSGDLFQRLKQRWTTGALIYSGQGKWYPGEQLPRWVLGCYWRKDGKPLWKDEALFADESLGYSFGPTDAENFVRTLAKRLKLDPDFVVPGFEDSAYFLWKEQRLAANVDALESKVKDPLERRRLARVFQKDLGEVIGYALPIAREGLGASERWTSCAWTFKSKNMYLIPGDSPMGLRMPLDSLPWSSPDDEQKIYDPDPLRPVDGPLPDDEDGGDSSLLSKKNRPKVRKGQSAKGILHTALCVQVRDGRMYVFLPPLESFDDYALLLNRIESTAKALQIPVVIEGYPPPYDSRVDCFKLTPDPGVIEVNVAPVSSFDELTNQVNSLYEEARLARLGTEKFMLDGRHSGTGGGNHIVLGGRTPAESPFLRRPDLLASFVAYWNNHPSLSYLFSGLFMGPTSQAPRVDEGRRDSVYELEIAIRQMNREIEKFGQCPPWMVDRLFRHLLIDGTGNTHRAEFCIDKLFSPDSATGRLGLVEFRGFEMPPHPRMSLLQQFLIRTMVLKFWKNPYNERLVRWGTTLHDRFLLPHFVHEDFEDVLSDMNSDGFDFDMADFAPHFEFRFPIIGQVSYNDIGLQIRTAIEPWYVLGEEPASGATARYVDSSVERLQLKVSGMTDPRFIVCCNGHPVPLHPTGAQGEFVAGIRYRAWQPPSCLHPTITVHSPLTIEIIDTWNRLSIGGCVYHVAHPGGRNYETFPVNALEAESRRAARFFKTGHTPGRMDHIPEPVTNPDYPLTLDLRRV